jgi:uncharacterized damage-inducible protein DinB
MAQSMVQFALGDLVHEAKSTKQMLARVPQDRWDWQPHEKSMTLGQLAAHIARLPLWGAQMTQADSFDFMNPGEFAKMPMATTAQEAVEHFERNVQPILDAVTNMDDATALRPYRLMRGEQVIYEAPKAAAIRHFLSNHLVHHRGQLSVYLRLLDAPVPGMYGQSADDKASPA